MRLQYENCYTSHMLIDTSEQMRFRSSWICWHLQTATLCTSQRSTHRSQICAVSHTTRQCSRRSQSQRNYSTSGLHVFLSPMKILHTLLKMSLSHVWCRLPKEYRLAKMELLANQDWYKSAVKLSSPKSGSSKMTHLTIHTSLPRSKSARTTLTFPVLSTVKYLFHCGRPF